MREMKIENTEPKKETPHEVEMPLKEEDFNYSHARTGPHFSEERSGSSDDVLGMDEAEGRAGSLSGKEAVARKSRDVSDGADVQDEVPDEAGDKANNEAENRKDNEADNGLDFEIDNRTDYEADKGTVYEVDRETDGQAHDKADSVTENEDDDEAAYEARRAQRLERVRKRRRRRKIRRITTGILIVAAAVIAGAAIYYGDRLQFGQTSGEPQLTAAGKTQNASGTGLSEDEEENGANAGDADAAGAGGETGIGDAAGADEGSGTGDAGADVEGTGSENGDGQAGGALTAEAESVLERARFHAAQYDYDRAIVMLKKDPAYGSSQEMQQAVAEFEEAKASCVSWPIEEVTHVFYHSLIADTSKAFDGDYKEADYNQVMTTIDEFNKITQIMYDKGYVMVSIYDMASVNEDGTMSTGEILLPPGKIPFVLSQDDLSYYHYMEGDGYPTRLIVDENGKVRNEYLEDDGSVSVGDYDVVPLIDRFVEEHPDFSYRGAKGIVALTGYNGILGYRTDISYKTRPDDLDANKVEWLDAHPDFSLKKERKGAKKVAKAMRDNGWLFASHTWGHKNIADVTMERLEDDTQRFKENVDPLIGGTDIIIFAFGTDLTHEDDYSGEKFEFLKGQGYNYFCNVDSRKYFVQIRDRYFRMGRRNLDGYRMYYNPELLEDLFDVQEVFDPARPTPVPPMG